MPPATLLHTAIALCFVLPFASPALADDKPAESAETVEDCTFANNAATEASQLVRLTARSEPSSAVRSREVSALPVTTWIVSPSPGTAHVPLAAKPPSP